MNHASPIQMLAAAAACAALAFLIHRLHRAMRDNRFMPLKPEMKGSRKGFNFNGRDGVAPFVDMHQARTVQRTLMGALLLSWTWVLGFAAAAMTVVALRLTVVGG